MSASCGIPATGVFADNAPFALRWILSIAVTTGRDQRARRARDAGARRIAEITDQPFSD
jgi:hypothetical protein